VFLYSFHAYIYFSINISRFAQIESYNIGIIVMLQVLPVDFKQICVAAKDKPELNECFLFFLEYVPYKGLQPGSLRKRELFKGKEKMNRSHGRCFSEIRK